jgi:hypothetical protein
MLFAILHLVDLNFNSCFFCCVDSVTSSESVLSLIVSLLNQYASRVQLSSNYSRALGDIAGFYLLFQLSKQLAYVFSLEVSEITTSVENTAYELAKLLPSVQKQLADEKASVEKTLEADLKTKTRAMGEPLFALPKQGQSAESILTLMKNALISEDEIWENGKVSGCVYHGDRNHQQLLNTAYSMYSLSVSILFCSQNLTARYDVSFYLHTLCFIFLQNPLHPDIWPSATKFESEIIAMCATMMTPGKKCTTVCGSTTSGGTESILLATKTHRQFYCQKYNITEPEIIACESAHAAIDKACDILGIRLIKLPMDPVTFKLNVSEVKRVISPNTIMIYGSAPTFPQGVIDDISGLSELAVKYDIGLHVDMCLGGFILPFAKKMGYNVPDFDFDLPGVTSMSVDTHKFGYALKGSSVVLYRNVGLRHAQYFTCPKWPGGLYSTPGKVAIIY